MSQVLSDAVLAKYGEAPPERGGGGLTVTGISPCPYETYINYMKLDPPAHDALDRMRMEDGHSQEAECLRLLWKAGFTTHNTLSNQLTVYVGKADIPGHPDGLIEIGDKLDMLEIKAMSLDRFTHFSQKGLDGFLRYKCQVQAYMASKQLSGMGVNRCWVLAKHKDSCRLHDVLEERDSDFIQPLLDTADAVILDGYVPEKVRSGFCPVCYHREFCWGEDMLLDMAGVKVMDLPEAVKKWKEGKYHRDYGNTLNEEAREVFKRELGDKDILLAEDLKIQKILATRTSMDIEKFVEIFGANRLPEVMKETVVEQMRVSEVGYE